MKLSDAAAAVAFAALFSAVFFPARPAPLPEPVEDATPGFDPVAAWAEMDVDLLAKTAEAEDPDAAAAVMWVVVNRAAGRPLCAAVLEPGAFESWQYGDPSRRWRRWWYRYPGEYERLRGLASRVLRGELPDPTGGATHFHRLGTPAPPWAPAPAGWTGLGRHVFYRERG